MPGLRFYKPTKEHSESPLENYIEQIHSAVDTVYRYTVESNFRYILLYLYCTALYSDQKGFEFRESMGTWEAIFCLQTQFFIFQTLKKCSIKLSTDRKTESTKKTNQ